MIEFYYMVKVDTDTEEHADQVIRERIGPDEDYGFEYTGFAAKLDTDRLDMALADLERIARWLAEDTDNDEAQGAAADLNAIREFLDLDNPRV